MSATPSPSLAEYLANPDPNAFWRLASGDHENLLDEAVEALRQIAMTSCGIPGHAVAVPCGAADIAYKALRGGAPGGDR